MSTIAQELFGRDVDPFLYQVATVYKNDPSEATFWKVYNLLVRHDDPLTIAMTVRAISRSGGGGFWLNFLLDKMKRPMLGRDVQFPSKALHLLASGIILGIFQTEIDKPPTALVLGSDVLADLMLQENLPPGLRGSEYTLDLAYERQLGEAIRAWMSADRLPRREERESLLREVRDSFSVMRKRLARAGRPQRMGRVRETGSVYPVPTHEFTPSGLLLCDKLFFNWISALHPLVRVEDYILLLDFLPECR